MQSPIQLKADTGTVSIEEGCTPCRSRAPRGASRTGSLRSQLASASAQVSRGQKPRTDLLRDQRGLSTMEYAVLFVIIIVGAIALWSALGDELASNIERGTGTVQDALEGHNPGGGSSSSSSLPGPGPSASSGSSNGNAQGAHAPGRDRTPLPR